VPNPEPRRERTATEIAEAIATEPTRGERYHHALTTRWEAKSDHVRTFLEEQYNGRCQICDTTFKKRDDRPYFEGVYLVSHTEKRWIDREGNVLCLCANCCAKFQHGSVEPSDVVEQLLALRLSREGGSDALSVRIRLCGEEVRIRFKERHLLDLQEMLRASAANASVATDDQVTG
jgi:hypothetical protein